MYEPIIDPMIFYLIELVEKLQLAPIFVLFMGVLFGFSLLLYLMDFRAGVNTISNPPGEYDRKV